MAKLLDKVILYNVLYPLEDKPDMDEIEMFTVQQLQKGRSIQEIEGHLRFPVKPVLEALIDKKVLRRDFTLELPMARTNAENIVLAYDTANGMFYNEYLYPGELNFEDGHLLFCFENSYVSKQEISWFHIFSSQVCFCKPAGSKKTVRRLAHSVFEAF